MIFVHLLHLRMLCWMLDVFLSAWYTTVSDFYFFGFLEFLFLNYKMFQKFRAVIGRSVLGVQYYDSARKIVKLLSSKRIAIQLCMEMLGFLLVILNLVLVGYSVVCAAFCSRCARSSVHLCFGLSILQTRKKKGKKVFQLQLRNFQTVFTESYR